MNDDLTLPDFLNRKLNGIATDLPTGTVRRREQKLVWPKKRNWRKIVERRRRREAAENAAPNV
jgi:hypothetical protein